MQKIRVIAMALAALFLTSACAAGQIAATAEQQATLDGVNRTLGQIGLHGLSLGAPSKGPSYPAGSNIAIDMVLVNSGTQPDTLVSITSGAGKGWASFPQPGTSAVLTNAGGSGAGTGGTQSVTIPASSQVPSGPTSKIRLVLLNTTRRLWPGTVVSLVFQFQNAGTIHVPVPIHLTNGVQGGLTVPPAPSPSPVGQ